MTRSIDLIIFDCDGVLVDSEILSSQIYADYLTAVGFPHTPAECDARYLGMTDASMVRIFAQQGTPLPDTFVDDVLALEHDVMARDLQAIPDIHAALRDIDVPYCVGSSGHPGKINHSLTKTGLADFFGSNIFSGTQVENGKPAPDLFLFAAEQMNTPPERVLVIEDSPAGVQAGVAAGMTVVGFTGGSHISPGHDDTLCGLGAHHILDHMNGLPDLIARLQT